MCEWKKKYLLENFTNDIIHTVVFIIKNKFFCYCLFALVLEMDCTCFYNLFLLFLILYLTSKSNFAFLTLNYYVVNIKNKCLTRRNSVFKYCFIFRVKNKINGSIFLYDYFFSIDVLQILMAMK